MRTTILRGAILAVSLMAGSIMAATPTPGQTYSKLALPKSGTQAFQYQCLHNLIINGTGSTFLLQQSIPAREVRPDYILFEFEGPTTDSKIVETAYFGGFLGSSPRAEGKYKKQTYYLHKDRKNRLYRKLSPDEKMARSFDKDLIPEIDYIDARYFEVQMLNCTISVPVK